MKLRALIIAFLISLINYSSLGASNMDFKTIDLENGVKIKHLYRDNIPIIYLSALIKASPIDELKPSQAYLTANLLTHGTKNRTARQIEYQIDFLAISIDKKVTHDYTLFTLATTKRHLKEAVELFFDILKNPIFPEEELKKEISKLEKYLRQMEEDPSFIANKNFFKNLFGEDHPYGRPVEGLPELVNNISRDDINSFYEKLYKPGNIILSFVGDINEKELNEIQKKYIINWRDGVNDRKINIKTSKKRDIKIDNFIKRDDLTQSTIVLGFESLSRKDPEFYSLIVMNYVLGGGGLTSRLARTVREEQGLAYSIYSTFTPYLFPGAFYIEVKTKAENSEKVISMILNEIKKMSENGITKEELEEAKSFLIGSFPLRIDTMRKISEFLTVIDFYGLGDDYFKKYADYINSVTTDDIKKLASKILQYDNYILVVVGP